MLSPESARNIHRKKAGDKGKKVSVGEEAAVEDYYLNFRKGAYQVTLSGYDTQKETLECFSTWLVWSLKGSSLPPSAYVQNTRK